MKSLSQETGETFRLRAQHYDYEARWIRDRDLIQPLVPPPYGTKRLLDVCSGTGAVTYVAQEMGWDVFAVDTSRSMLLIQQKKESSRIVLCSGEELPYADEAFDVVTIRQGLHYLGLPESIHELLRVAKREVRIGTITAATRDDISWWTDYFKIASPGRRHVFVPGEISTIAARFSVKVSEVIKYSRDSFRGSISHLSTMDQATLINHVISAPSEIASAYHFRAGAETPKDFWYDLRWEFITLEKPILT